jgi:hypothetical protein
MWRADIENLISNVIRLALNVGKRVSFLKCKLIAECDREAKPESN